MPNMARQMTPVAREIAARHTPDKTIQQSK
jgi:hypothetical protein